MCTNFYGGGSCGWAPSRGLLCFSCLVVVLVITSSCTILSFVVARTSSLLVMIQPLITHPAYNTRPRSYEFAIVLCTHSLGRAKPEVLAGSSTYISNT